jgi:hypothetical protein
MKYPRTLHLPWSEGMTSDDKMLPSTDIFINKRVVGSEKYDGENTGMTSVLTHARSLDSKDHPSRHWVKGIWGSIKSDIPENMKIFGENVYAKHSIHYKKLETFFYVISIWEDDICLSWDDTKEWCELLNLTHVPVIYDGIYDENLIKTLYSPIKPNGDEMEGYVVRNANSFNFNDFKGNLGKFVRANHIQSSEHWMYEKMIRNEQDRTKY